MAIVEGQIETLKKLKTILDGEGITRFNSVGQIERFCTTFESEKKGLSSHIERTMDSEMQAMYLALISYEDSLGELVDENRNNINQKIIDLAGEKREATEKSNSYKLYKILYFIKIKYLSYRSYYLENNIEKIVKKKSRKAENEVVRQKNKIQYLLDNRETISSERCKKSRDDLMRTKAVVDGLYPTITGAIGEGAVVKVLKKLSDDYYVINDFSIKFDPPIYNKKEKDRISSIQIDHLLVCRSGVFILETKNWNKYSIENQNLRSPVQQVMRTGFAVFILLNKKSKLSDFWLRRHHWGSKKIPIRNVIVMTNKMPKEEFKHVKIVSVNKLIGYVKYFNEIFSTEEVKSVFEYLKKKNSSRS